MNRRALIKPAGRAFAYFGHKMRYIDRYPVPRYDHIIEPFAGGAGYALRYCDLKVTLYELDEKVCMLWDYLINASEADILALPLMEPNQSVYDLNLEEGPTQLIGRWTNPMSGRFKPKIPNCMSEYMESTNNNPDSRMWSFDRRLMISQAVKRINHWKIINKSYEEAINKKATWFIDPPYASSVSKDGYKHHKIDYDQLASFCRSRKGQAIVCENTDSPQWLPFRELLTLSGGKQDQDKKRKSTEVLWCSDDRDYPMQQQSLL